MNYVANIEVKTSTISPDVSLMFLSVFQCYKNSMKIIEREKKHRERKKTREANIFRSIFLKT